MDKLDRRIEKTRSAIFLSFFELLQKKRYSTITIQEIIDQANVGRTTFYAHFPSKDDLLFACVNHLLSSMNGFLSGDGFIPARDVFIHIRANSRLVKGLMNSENSELLFSKFKSFWSSRVEDYLVENGVKDDNIPLEILAHHITSTFFELTKWWLNSDMPYSDEQLEKFFRSLVFPCMNIKSL